MQICIYEDEKHVNFEPLSLSRPIFDLVCGASTLKEKIQRAFPDYQILLHCRKYLERITLKNNPNIKVNKKISDEVLLINSRIIAPNNLKSLLKFKKGEEKIYLSGNDVTAAKLSASTLSKIDFRKGEPINMLKFRNIKRQKVNIQLANFIWDFIYKNEEELSFDIKYFE